MSSCVSEIAFEGTLFDLCWVSDVNVHSGIFLVILDALYNAEF